MRRVRYTFLIFSIGLATLTVCHAQAVSSSRKQAENVDRTVINEDRGQAFIITTPAQTVLPPIKGRVSLLPGQISIFLGDDWNEEPLRKLQPGLANLFESPMALDALRAGGIKAPDVPNPFIQLPFANVIGTVADLTIQERIRSALNDGILPLTEKDVIIVVFLAPSLHSHLAELESGKHYLAYRNNLNINAARIRYVVVPLDANPDDIKSVAQKAFLSASFQ